MNPAACPECGRPRHNAGNFYMSHGDMFHLMMRRRLRQGPVWRAVLAGVVVIAIVRRRA